MTELTAMSSNLLVLQPKVFFHICRTLSNKMLWILSKGLVMVKDLSDDGTCKMH